MPTQTIPGLPPLPPGYSIDASSLPSAQPSQVQAQPQQTSPTNLPPLPAGYTLENSGSSGQTPEPSTLSKIGSAALDFGKGVVPGAVESMGETIQSLPYIGKKIITPEAMQAERAYFAPGSPAEKAGQTTGNAAENVLEFVMGDEALKGLALSQKIGLASKIAKISQDSPYIGKLLEHGVNAARMGTVGTAQDQGATLPDALERGAVTGVSGELLKETPGLVKQVVKGEGIAQPAAEGALRQGVKAAGGQAAETSLRTTLEQPIDDLHSLAKSLYRQVDNAAGTDFKVLNNKLDTIEEAIRQSADPDTEAKLELNRQNVLNKIEDAKNEAIKQGVDPDLLKQADQHFKQARALSDLETKVFKNPNIVSGNATSGTPEKINVDGAVKAVQKLQDSTKYGGSRLEQALGKDGAKNLLDNLYAAQEQGREALSRQDIAKTLGKIVGIGGGYEAVKRTADAMFGQ